ncbi:Uncharacterized protein APZ42_024704 [Daphnia magna]|uniref:Uncharacterized protein n=1 Tax=Daphnia magna TaxID=35525 RepID=A0A164TUR2_9CRUS|nr:Uncharacterized protein APZ42_024704 [Daphnia magna]
MHNNAWPVTWYLTPPCPSFEENATQWHKQSITAMEKFRTCRFECSQWIA